MTTVDGDTALSVIRRENELLRSQIELLLEQTRNEIPAITAAIAPWVDRPHVRRGKPRKIDRRLDNPSRRDESRVEPLDYTGSTVKLRPELHQALIELCDWLTAADERIRPYTDSQFQKSRGIVMWSVKNRPPTGGFSSWNGIFINPGGGAIFPSIDYVVQSKTRFAPTHIEGQVKRIHEGAKRLAENLAVYEVPDQVLIMPKARPPRHGRLHDGIVARVLIEDLTNILHSGRSLEAQLGSGTAQPVDFVAWIETAFETVSTGLAGEVTAGFWNRVSGIYDCDISVIAHPALLSQAYLTLGLDFLEEVLEHMPEYAAASGQSVPSQQVNITGGTIYGGQFAAQITNIDSSIAGIAQSGGQEMVDALKALEQAVLSQAGLDDEHRQELLDNVADLADAANKPPEDRRRGRIKSALAALTASAAAAGELGQAVAAWEPVLNQLLP